MKHAGAETLRQLSDLLEQIRQRPGLKEKKVGIFYCRSKSFIHFHEDPAGLFAWKALLSAIDRALPA
jgi:hypothetical protein